MADSNMKTINIDTMEKKKELPSYMTSYQIFVRNISISQISHSSQETTNPYVTIRLKGGQKYAMTKSQNNTLDTNYDEVLQLDGQCVGSDVLIFLVYNQNGEQDPDKDECLGVQKLVVSSLDLGLVQQYDLKLYKTIDGTKKKDYDVKLGVAGVLHFEMQIAKLGTVQFKSNPWPPRIFYTLWIHVDKCKNVSLNSKTTPINPFIIARISPCLNSQKQTTPICFNSPNPIWNILQCFHIDNFEKQTVHVTLMNYEEGSAPKKISSIKIPINLARTDGRPFLSQMLFPLPEKNVKACTFQFKLQLLEPHSIPFDGMVPMKHQRLQLKMVIYDLINLPNSDTPQTVYCIINCGKINKRTNAVENTNPTEINQEITINNITQSQLVLINVIINDKLYGQVPVHLNNYLLTKKTEAQYYTLFKKASASIKYDLLLSAEDPESEEKEEVSDEIDENIKITIPPDINKYKNNYDKSFASNSASSSASASASSSPTKAANEIGKSDRIKALLEQAKSGGIAKAVESTSNLGSYAVNEIEQQQQQSGPPKQNRVQQLANQINNTSQAEPAETNHHPQIPLPQQQSANRANLAQKFLSQINSNQKTVETTTVQTTSTKQKQEESTESKQGAINTEKVASFKLLVDKIDANEESNESSGSTNPVYEVRQRSNSIKKKDSSRRLSAIISNNHNLLIPEEAEGVDANQDNNIPLDHLEPNSQQPHTKKRRYSTIHIRKEEEGVVNTEVENAAKQPPASHRTTIAQKYLNQVNSQKSSKEKEEHSIPKPQPPSNENKMNWVKQLANKINEAASTQTNEQSQGSHKTRRSTFNAKDALALTNDGIISKRRSSATNPSEIQAFNENQTQQETNQQTENSNSQEKQEQEYSAPKSPRTDNRANLAQKYLSQINSNQSSSVQSKSVVTKSTTESSETTEQSKQSSDFQSPDLNKINRVKQLVSQINNAASGKSETESSQLAKTRRATDAVNSITSTPSFNNIDKRRSSHNDSSAVRSPDSLQTDENKISRVKQLVNQINSVTSSQNSTTTTPIKGQFLTPVKDQNQNEIQIKEQQQQLLINQSSSSSSFTSATSVVSVQSTTSTKSVKSTTSTTTTSTKTIQSSTKQSSMQQSSMQQSSMQQSSIQQSSMQQSSIQQSSMQQSSIQQSSMQQSSSSKAIQSTKDSDLKALQYSTESKTRDITELDINHSDDICEFNWGRNDSMYSSSFTGFSECSRSLGSTNSSTAERFHERRHEDNDPDYKIKPEWHQKVFGKFISAKNLPIKTGKIFATLQLRGLGGLKHFKFTTDEVDPNNLMFNKQINFDRVKKGDSIEIILYAKNDDNDEQIPFASAKISCRNLKENIDEMYNVKLEKPTRLLYNGDKLNGFEDFGEVQMSLNSNVEFTVIE